MAPPAFHGYDRLLATGTGPDSESYRITQDDRLVVSFATAGINGKTPDETAEANLADFSEHNRGEFLLFRDEMLLAYSEGGIIFSLRPDNPALVRGRKEVAA